MAGGGASLFPPLLFLLFGPRAAGKREKQRAIPADVFVTAMISGKLGSGAGIVLPSDLVVRRVQFIVVSLLVAGLHGVMVNFATAV